MPPSFAFQSSDNDSRHPALQGDLDVLDYCDWLTEATPWPLQIQSDFSQLPLVLNRVFPTQPSFDRIALHLSQSLAQSLQTLADINEYTAVNLICTDASQLTQLATNAHITLTYNPEHTGWHMMAEGPLTASALFMTAAEWEEQRHTFETVYQEQQIIALKKWQKDFQKLLSQAQIDAQYDLEAQGILVGLLSQSRSLAEQLASYAGRRSAARKTTSVIEKTLENIQRSIVRAALAEAMPAIITTKLQSSIRLLEKAIPSKNVADLGITVKAKSQALKSLRRANPLKPSINITSKLIRQTQPSASPRQRMSKRASIMALPAHQQRLANRHRTRISQKIVLIAAPTAHTPVFKHAAGQAGHSIRPVAATKIVAPATAAPTTITLQNSSQKPAKINPAVIRIKTSTEQRQAFAPQTVALKTTAPQNAIKARATKIAILLPTALAATTKVSMPAIAAPQQTFTPVAVRSSQQIFTHSPTLQVAAVAPSGAAQAIPGRASPMQPAAMQQATPVMPATSAAKPAVKTQATSTPSVQARQAYPSAPTTPQVAGITTIAASISSSPSRAPSTPTAQVSAPSTQIKATPHKAHSSVKQAATPQVNATTSVAEPAPAKPQGTSKATAYTEAPTPPVEKSEATKFLPPSNASNKPDLTQTKPFTSAAQPIRTEFKEEQLRAEAPKATTSDNIAIKATAMPAASADVVSESKPLIKNSASPLATTTKDELNISESIAVAVSHKVSVEVIGRELSEPLKLQTNADEAVSHATKPKKAARNRLEISDSKAEAAEGKMHTEDGAAIRCKVTGLYICNCHTKDVTMKSASEVAPERVEKLKQQFEEQKEHICGENCPIHGKNAPRAEKKKAARVRLDDQTVSIKAASHVEHKQAEGIKQRFKEQEDHICGDNCPIHGKNSQNNEKKKAPRVRLDERGETKIDETALTESQRPQENKKKTLRRRLDA